MPTKIEALIDRKWYVGDGVYAVFNENAEVILTTENGIAVTNTIVLEPVVMQQLRNYFNALDKALKENA